MRWILAAFCAVLVLESCVRSDRAAAVPAPTPGAAREDAADPGSGPGSGTAGTSGETAAEEPRETSTPAPAQPDRSVSPAQRAADRRAPVPQLPVTRTDRLSAVISEVPVGPLDFRLGPLAGATRSGDESAMMRTADRFFSEVRSGTISRASVGETSLAHLTRSLRPYLVEGADIAAVRYGRPTLHSSDSAELPVRLFGTNGDTVGLLLYRLVGNDWFVSDLHANLRTLSVPSPGRSEPFNPLDPAERG
jgi:hypothetical protein